VDPGIFFKGGQVRRSERRTFSGGVQGQSHGRDVKDEVPQKLKQSVKLLNKF